MDPLNGQRKSCGLLNIQYMCTDRGASSASPLLTYPALETCPAALTF